MKNLKTAFGIFIVSLILAVSVGRVMKSEYTTPTLVNATVIGKASASSRYGLENTIAIKYPNGYTKDLNVTLATYSEYDVGDVWVTEVSPSEMNYPSPPGHALLLYVLMTLFLLTAISGTASFVFAVHAVFNI